MVRDSVRRSRTRRLEALELLRELGGADLAALTGFLVAAAVRRTPVVLDGAVSTACGLIAAELATAAPAYFVAGHRSTEPAHRLALEHLRLEPLLDLSLNLGAGTGALLAVPVIDSAVAVIRDMTARPAVVEAEVEPEAT